MSRMSRMSKVVRRLGRLAVLLGVAVGVVGGLLNARPSQAQGNIDTFPEWIIDSFIETNPYLSIYEYFRDGEETKFNIWTNGGNPLTSLDDFFYVISIDAQGNVTVVWPWGTRLWSGQRPMPRSGTSGDDRPYCNHLTIQVEDPSQTDGFSFLQYPEDGTPQFAPPVISLPRNQGFFAPYDFESGTDYDITVNQKVQFARDLVRVEVVVRNNGTQTRRVGARMLLDPFPDVLTYRTDVFGSFPVASNCRSVFLPETRERVFFERDYTGAQVPTTWELYDDDEGPNPVFATKAILRGNGATTPSRIVFGNTLDMWPVVEGGTNAQNYQWVVRPEFELRIADIGSLLYWDPVAIPGGQSRSFVTYIGLAGAGHGMSDAYIATQGNPSGFITPQGFIGAVQAPFALPLVNSNADGLFHNVTAYMQSAFAFSMPNCFSFIDLPPGLQFSSADPDQPARRDFGSIQAVGNQGDEANATWTIEANGDEAGLLPIDVIFGNGFQDTARSQFLLNVPQGRRYRFTEDWRMMSFPFTYVDSQNDPVELFRDLSGNPIGANAFQALRYNPQINQYEQTDQILPGEGYWVRSRDFPSRDIRLPATAQAIALSTTDVFLAPIRRGWNQVGNPSPYVVRVADLRFSATGSQLIGFDEAVRRNLVRSALFEYNRTQNRYTQLNRDAVLKPGHGVWIFSNAEQNVVWPAPQGPALSIQ